MNEEKYNHPDIIYLTRGDRDTWEEAANDDIGIQNCEDLVNSDDVAYIRKDIYDALLAKLQVEPTEEEIKNVMQILSETPYNREALPLSIEKQRNKAIAAIKAAREL